MKRKPRWMKVHVVHADGNKWVTVNMFSIHAFYQIAANCFAVVVAYEKLLLTKREFNRLNKRMLALGILP